MKSEASRCGIKCDIESFIIMRQNEHGMESLWRGECDKVAVSCISLKTWHVKCLFQFVSFQVKRPFDSSCPSHEDCCIDFGEHKYLASNNTLLGFGKRPTSHHINTDIQRNAYATAHNIAHWLRCRWDTSDVTRIGKSDRNRCNQLKLRDRAFDVPQYNVILSTSSFQRSLNYDQTNHRRQKSSCVHDLMKCGIHSHMALAMDMEYRVSYNDRFFIQVCKHTWVTKTLAKVRKMGEEEAYLQLNITAYVIMFGGSELVL